MGEFSLTHLLLLAVIALVLFGPSRLPALGQSLGKAIKAFKQGLNEIDADVRPVNDAVNKQTELSFQEKQQLSSTQAQKDSLLEKFVEPIKTTVQPLAQEEAMAPQNSKYSEKHGGTQADQTRQTPT